MRKTFLLVTVVSLMLLNVVSCFAFPAPGQYGSEEKVHDAAGNVLDLPLWQLEINQTDHYYGKIIWASRKVWTGEWSVPLTITPNSDGRYMLEAKAQSNSIKMEIQETADGSFIMYIKYTSSEGVEEYTANMKTTTLSKPKEIENW